MEPLKWFITVLCLIFLFLDIGIGQVPSGPTIAFTCHLGNGVDNLCLIDPNGDNFRPLFVGGKDPAWSPDGRFIYCMSKRDGNWDIYRISADGKNPVNLTEHPADDMYPEISPDGKQLVFYSKRPPSGLFLMDVEGRNVRHLTFGFLSSWAPDGRRIVFHKAWEPDLWVISVDGGNPMNVTGDGQANSDPAWSPDGRLIAYESWRDGDPINVAEIYVMEPNGEGKRRLTQAPGLDWSAAWSPDSQKIVFTSDRDGGSRLYLMNADGTRQKPLSPFGVRGFEPSWFDPAFSLPQRVMAKTKLPTLWGAIKSRAAVGGVQPPPPRRGRGWPETGLDRRPPVD
jgi:TolB protein